MIYVGCKTLGHDTAAAVVNYKGNVLAASAQERFDRVKHSKSFPKEALLFCCKTGRTNIEKLPFIAVSFDYKQAFQRLILETTLKYFPKSLKSLYTMSRYMIQKKIDSEKVLRKELSFKGKIIYYDHHDCHAASAYYMSQFNNSLIITIDGRGEWVTTRSYLGKGTKIQKIEDIACYPHSLGLFYTAITEYLGFVPNSGEGTLMALAAFGNPETYYKDFREFFRIRNGKFTLDTNYFIYHLDKDKRLSNKFINHLGVPRKKNSKITKRHKDI